MLEAKNLGIWAERTYQGVECSDKWLHQCSHSHQTDEINRKHGLSSIWDWEAVRREVLWDHPFHKEHSQSS